MENTIESRTFNVLYDGKIAWNVIKEQQYVKNEGVDGAPDEYIPSGGYCTRRSDTKAILGLVGTSYMPFQNGDLVKEFLEATKEFGLQTIEGVAVNGGKKIVLKARIGDIQVGTDTVQRYITGSNTHDGSGPLRLGMYNRVKVCSNGLHKEFNSKELATVKHTTNATERMKYYLKHIPVALRAEEEMMANYQKWSQIPVDKKHVKEVLRKIYGVDPNAKPEEVSAKKKAQVDRFMNAVKNNGLNVHGETLWGLFSAQTWIGSRDTKGVLNNDRVMAGKSQEMSLMTYDLLLEMMDSSYEYHVEEENVMA